MTSAPANATQRPSGDAAGGPTEKHLGPGKVEVDDWAQIWVRDRAPVVGLIRTSYAALSKPCEWFSSVISRSPLPPG
jgi:hypothetical protein